MNATAARSTGGTLAESVVALCTDICLEVALRVVSLQAAPRSFWEVKRTRSAATAIKNENSWRFAILIECSKAYASRNCTNSSAQHLSLLGGWRGFTALRLTPATRIRPRRPPRAGGGLRISIATKLTRITNTL